MVDVFTNTLKSGPKPRFQSDEAKPKSRLVVAFSRDDAMTMRRRRVMAAAQFERANAKTLRPVIKSIQERLAWDLGVTPRRVKAVLGGPVAELLEFWEKWVEGTDPRTIILM